MSTEQTQPTPLEPLVPAATLLPLVTTDEAESSCCGGSCSLG